MKRSYYSENFKKFSETDNNQVLGILTKNHRFELDLNQKNAWEEIFNDLPQRIEKSFDKLGTKLGGGLSVKIEPSSTL